MKTGPKEALLIVLIVVITHLTHHGYYYGMVSHYMMHSVHSTLVQ